MAGGPDRAHARLARLMILTSFETYKELGELGLAKRERMKTLADIARTELLEP